MRLLYSVSALALIGAAPIAASAQVTPAPLTSPPPATPAPSPPPAAEAEPDPFATPPSLGGVDTASPPAAASVANADAVLPGQRDPLEKFNRGVWGLNQTVDRIVLKPASKAYRFVAPKPVRTSVSNIFSNFSEPWSFINNLLQLKLGRAANTLGRFVINSTLGLGGIGDIATKMGLRQTPEDFGQTLARYGAKTSPYLVIPLLGPSTIRDGIGSGVAYFGDPVPICIKQCTNLNFVERSAVQVVRVVSARSDLTDSGADAFLESSLDPYATARSAFFQRRAIELNDGEAESATPMIAGGLNAGIAPVAATAADPADPFATPPALPADGAAPATTPAPGAPPAAR